MSGAKRIRERNPNDNSSSPDSEVSSSSENEDSEDSEDEIVKNIQVYSSDEELYSVRVEEPSSYTYDVNCAARKRSERASSRCGLLLTESNSGNYCLPTDPLPNLMTRVKPINLLGLG